jgi:hypothetical protein
MSGMLWAAISAVVLHIRDIRRLFWKPLRILRRRPDGILEALGKTRSLR